MQKKHSAYSNQSQGNMSNILPDPRKMEEVNIGTRSASIARAEKFRARAHSTAQHLGRPPMKVTYKNVNRIKELNLERRPVFDLTLKDGTVQSLDFGKLFPPSSFYTVSSSTDCATPSGSVNASPVMSGRGRMPSYPYPGMNLSNLSNSSLASSVAGNPSFDDLV